MISMTNKKNKFEKELLKKLNEIIRLLRVMSKTYVKESKEELISTSLRRRMFKLMNGKRSTKEIAKISETTKRNVDIFVKELHTAGLIILIKKGKGKTKCPKKL